jgi:hypothetical protein
VLGLRFEGDPFVPTARFAFLRETLDDAPSSFRSRRGHPKGPLEHRHSVLTTDLIDCPGEPTYEARAQVLALLRRKLLY